MGGIAIERYFRTTVVGCASVVRGGDLASDWIPQLWRSTGDAERAFHILRLRARHGDKVCVVTVDIAMEPCRVLIVADEVRLATKPFQRTFDLAVFDDCRAGFFQPLERGYHTWTQGVARRRSDYAVADASRHDNEPVHDFALCNRIRMAAVAVISGWYYAARSVIRRFA